MIQMLLDYGAEVNSADEDGYTPLHTLATICAQLR